MEVTRRRFGRMIVSIAVLLLAAVGLAARGAVTRCRTAVRAVTFPGRVRPRDDAEVGRPGRWSG